MGRRFQLRPTVPLGSLLNLLGSMPKADTFGPRHSTQAFREEQEKMASNCEEVTPYWSTRVGETRYHVCKNCTVGDNIESDYRKSGPNPPSHLSLCDRCKDIRAGKV